MPPLANIAQRGRADRLTTSGSEPTWARPSNKSGVACGRQARMGVCQPPIRLLFELEKLKGGWTGGAVLRRKWRGRAAIDGLAKCFETQCCTAAKPRIASNLFWPFFRAEAHPTGDGKAGGKIEAGGASFPSRHRAAPSASNRWHRPRHDVAPGRPSPAQHLQRRWFGSSDRRRCCRLVRTTRAQRGTCVRSPDVARPRVDIRRWRKHLSSSGCRYM